MSDYKIRVEVGSDYSLAVETAKINNNLDDLKIKIADKKKEKGKNILTFSDGSQIVINDGASPIISEDGYWHINGQSTGVKARAEHSFKELTPAEKEEIKGEKGDSFKFSELTQSQKEELRGKRGYPGEGSKITKTEYDSSGNTILTFNDGTRVTINKGDKGDKGNTGESVKVASVTKSGTTNTVKFTDGKSMEVEDGKSVNVASTRILDDGNTEITFTDGKKAIVRKGQDGTVKFDDLTEEQRESLQVDVVDDLTSGGSDKALSAEQGKNLLNIIAKYHSDAKPLVMTAVIDQANSNPLTCITYEDDAKLMEKGSPEWNDFFRSQLILFKDGKEVRELEDSELNDLKPEDGDVMVRFPRKGLRIKTVGEKVYVSMTNVKDDPNFKYYAHSRGDKERKNFYLGAYLGVEESGKLRSITGKTPTGNKTIGDFRTIAQANGVGYEQLAFYQWTFLQAMYVLKYGNLDSQTALGKGNTSGSNCDKATGETNGKGIDFGNTDVKTKVRFQWVEDFFGTKYQWLDGFKTESGKMWTGTDKFSNEKTNYKEYKAYETTWVYPKSVIGNTEQGFIVKESGASESTHYINYQIVKDNSFAFVGSGANDGNAGVFSVTAHYPASIYLGNVGARLMFL